MDVLPCEGISQGKVELGGLATPPAASWRIEIDDTTAALLEGSRLIVHHVVDQPIPKHGEIYLTSLLSDIQSCQSDLRELVAGISAELTRLTLTWPNLDPDAWAQQLNNNLLVIGNGDDQHAMRLRQPKHIGPAVTFLFLMAAAADGGDVELSLTVQTAPELPLPVALPRD